MSNPLHHSLTQKEACSRTLFVGDIHGCAHELQQLLELCAPNRVILIGDLFTKGPDPLGVWTLIEQWQAEAVLGNHDDTLVAQFRSKGIQQTPTTKIELPKKALEWLEKRPLVIEGSGWRAVHASVNPKERKTSRWMALFGRRWPDDSQSTNPFWWQLYQGKELIIYGHDAKRGLQDHRPKTLGLDSGCVYGGQLSGYLLEEDLLYQIPSGGPYVEVVEKESTL